MIAVEAAAADGQPFTKTGENGVYKQKARMPPELCELSRARLESLVETGLEQGLIVAALAEGSKVVQQGGQVARCSVWPVRSRHRRVPGGQSQVRGQALARSAHSGKGLIPRNWERHLRRKSLKLRVDAPSGTLPSQASQRKWEPDKPLFLLSFLISQFLPPEGGRRSQAPAFPSRTRARADQPT